MGAPLPERRIFCAAAGRLLPSPKVQLLAATIHERCAKLFLIPNPYRKGHEKRCQTELTASMVESVCVSAVLPATVPGLGTGRYYGNAV